jgi:single-strand DNA-binding protein
MPFFEVVVEEQEFAESKKASQSNNPQGTNQGSYSVDANGFMNIPDGIDEELPFN